MGKWDGEGRKRGIALTKAQRLEARGVALELLAQLQLPKDVVAVLVELYGVSEQTARRVINEAEGDLARADEATAEARVARHRRQLEALYRRAWSRNQLGVCANVMQRLARMDGIEGALRVKHEGLGVGGTEEEFAERTDADLEHFAEHGYWPGDPPPVATLVSGQTEKPNALEKLH